jgi:polyhydroxyalkanoate synthase subunit PhaC
MDARENKGKGPSAPRPNPQSKASAQSRTVYRQSRAMSRKVPEEALAAAARSEEILDEERPVAPAGKIAAAKTTETASPESVQPTPVQTKPVVSTAPVIATPAPPHAPAAVVPHATHEKKGAEHAAAKPDFDLLSKNVALAVTEGAKALSAALEPLKKGDASSNLTESVNNVLQSFGSVAEFWLTDPARTLEAQSSLQANLFNLWAHTLRRMNGAEDQPVVPRDPADKRFAAPQWQESPVFDFLRQAHAITTNWADDLVTRADTADAHTRAKARFYVRQISSALSPSNFIATNPVLLHETLASNAENLARGAELLIEDIEAGHGTLKIRQSDSSKFELGVNMAVTPGEVIFRNELFELIQYAPVTETVYKRPVLIVPPWINKYYILDLNHEKSFVRYMTEQGLTVFLISWVNPDETLRDKTFEDYMRQGIFTALDVIEDVTHEKDVAAMGYCVGGTLLAVTLAYMARMGDTRISSATFLATQTDFADPGDLKVFVDEAQVRSIEDDMAERGYLDGSKMATAFNMLRPNDLIWSFVVNNYVRGKKPMPFDLLAWNSDATRLPAANHSFYLRNCYLENNLTQGRMVIGGEKLDLSQVTIPVYNLATREDHIAPAKSVFNGAKFFGGDMRYVLSGSGHIAGVINPPEKHKYQYWTGPRPHGEFSDWMHETTQTKGSWWPDWIAWLTHQAQERVAARIPGGGKHKPLYPAPGDYVRVMT